MDVWITRNAIEKGIRCCTCDVDHSTRLVYERKYPEAPPFRLGDDAFIKLEDAKLRVILTARAKRDAALETAREMTELIDLFTEKDGK